MTTLILPPRYSDDSNTLWRTAIALGWNIERLQNWRLPEGFHPGSDIAIYGESLWANFVAEQLGLHLYEPPLDWLTQLAPEFVGRKIEFCTLEEARDKQFPAFIKPAGEKSFEARVYHSAGELPPDTTDEEQASVPVLVSELVEWEVEYRCFVVYGRMETISSYWRGDTSTRDDAGFYPAPPDELEAAHAFAARVLEKHGHTFGEYGVVMDVGRVRDFGWAVVEANPAFGAGLYGCDPQKVLNVIAHCAYHDNG